MSEDIPELDLDQIFEKMALPEVPNDSFTPDNQDLLKIVSWAKAHAAMVLAGLSTEPQYHANGIRIDWLQRLVLSKANGDLEPANGEIERALNEGLASSGINRLEDPNEDLFCDLIATKRGNFRIFPGQWELAAPYTQTLIEAFEMLPKQSSNLAALNAAHALLVLSDEIAARAGVDRKTQSSGTPFANIQIPHDAALREMGKRVQFNKDDLRRLEVESQALSVFLLSADQLPLISAREIGETPLERCPILRFNEELVVASPNCLSLAIRGILVNAALKAGMSRLLQDSLLRSQERYAESTGFFPVSQLNLSGPTKHSFRGTALQYDHGQYLHVLQLPTSFDGFPNVGFSTVRALSSTANQFIADDVSRFWRYLGAQSNHRKSATVLLLSGWGATHSFNPPIIDREAPNGWHFMALSFADAAVLGACDDGKLTDIVRLFEQNARLKSDGITFINPSGVLNLYGFSQITDGNLIPEHMTEIELPLTIMMGTNDLLGPRIEGTTRRDYRAMQISRNGYSRVQRIEWGKQGQHAIYASLDDLAAGRLLGGLTFKGRTWWIKSTSRDGKNSSWHYEVWNAVLQWLAAVGPPLIEKLPGSFPTKPTQILLEIPPSSAFERIPSSEIEIEIEIDKTIEVGRATDSDDVVVAIREEWLPYLRLPQNLAEIELVVSVLDSIAGRDAAPKGQLVELTKEIVGSADWRWLHATEARTPLDRIAGKGLVGPFEAVPKSAFSLVKCRSIWEFRDRSEGPEIKGEDECKLFLSEYQEKLLDSLIRDVKPLNRASLVLAAANNYQSGRREQSIWRDAIRALRAIHGEEKANRDAFARQNEINALQRAAKIVAEISACEASGNDGFEPARTEIEELYAKTLLLVGNSQLFAAIRSGLIPAVIKISPAGDLLTERGILTTILEPGAMWLTNRGLNEAAASYTRRHIKSDTSQPEQLVWDGRLRAAVEAEFQVSAEAYVDLQFVLAKHCETIGRGTFYAKHSELVKIIRNDYSDSKASVLSLLQRLTLTRRASWGVGLSEANRDIGRFDRPLSLINRPFLMIDDDMGDPKVLVSPTLISDSTMYGVSGLLTGTLNNEFWQSAEARSYAGAQGHAAGREFEETVAMRLRELGIEARTRCALSALLNRKVDASLGDTDVLAISNDRKRIWIIEAKNLKLCRTEAEAASRMSAYRGRMRTDSRGRSRPDELLRHTRRVEYLRSHSTTLKKTLKLSQLPEVRGLLVVDAPQPMNFHMLEDVPDGRSVFLDSISTYPF